MNKKVCVYCRVATEKQANLDFQIKNLKNFAKQKNLEIVKIISEFGSGSDLNRDGLHELVKIAKSKQADIILTRDVSRISRDTVYNLKFIEDIKKHIEFKTIYAFDISDDDWNGMLSVLSEFFKQTKKEQIA